MWDLPGPGLEPVFPALAGGFLTAAPPGKPLYLNFELRNLKPRNVQWLIGDINVKRVVPLSIASNLKVPWELQNGEEILINSS